MFALLSFTGVSQAHADDDWQYQSYYQDITISSDGVATVVLDAVYDFGSTPGHGPMLTFITRMRMSDGRYRVLDTDVLSVTSLSGADTNMNFDYSANTMTLRVGTQGNRFTGLQQYRITYTISGLVTPDHPESALDEFNWNNIGTGGNMPHNDVQVRITGPAYATAGACFYGSSFDQPCESQILDGTVLLRVDSLRAGEPMQVVAGYPVGTFPNVVPEYVDSTDENPWIDQTPTSPFDFVLPLLLTVAGVGGVVTMARRNRDLAYAGVTPGNRPLPGQEPTYVFRDKKAPVAVWFTPPEGVRPAEGLYLMNLSSSSPELASSTMIDLAVRGYIQIEQSSKKNFVFHLKGGPAAGLRDYEQKLLDSLFKNGNSVTTKDLKKGKNGDIAMKMNASLTSRVVNELRWTNVNPTTALGSGLAISATLIVIGIANGVFGLFGNFLWSIPFIVTGVAVMLQSNRLSHRTAEGSAVLAQVKGFQKYIATAEADQLRWEEGQDIFSEYLPWAIAFGEAERWTKLFQELVAAGTYTQTPVWFDSYYGGFWVGNAWANSMNTFSSALSDSVSRSEAFATSGSSAASFGGSGFSGGGGFGGGGSGGW